MFRKLEKKKDNKDAKWLSCWGSSTTALCKFSGCPEGNIPTFTPQKSNYGWKCRGGMFWIYSDSDTIEHGSTVNIQYWPDWYGRGIWLKWSDGLNLRTGGCPTTKFTHIRKECPKENLVIRKQGKTDKDIRDKQEDTIYDGNVIDLGYGFQSSCDFVILKKDAETNNQDRVSLLSTFHDDDGDDSTTCSCSCSKKGNIRKIKMEIHGLEN